MTTEVIVRANCGLPVVVFQDVLNEDDYVSLPVIVQAGEERTFHVHSTTDLVIHEIQADEEDDPRLMWQRHFYRPFTEEDLSADSILKFFNYAHLPKHLQSRSKVFFVAARQIIEKCPRNPERTVALRKLLEAKDAAVRAAL